MTNDKSRRSLSWGSVRSEAVSGARGDIVLHGLDTEDLTKLAEHVESFLFDFLDRGGIESSELKTLLLNDSWLLGYAFGACAACFNQRGIASDTGLIGFSARVCGEMLGGGIRSKVEAFETLTKAASTAEFIRGQDRGTEDWMSRWMR